MDVNTDKMVKILKEDKPLSVIMVEEYGKDKLVCLFALPHLFDRIQKFAKEILEGDNNG